ncbi:hypothetical protein B0H63DRAFT_150924 [Podospora didyma]|uniref:Chromosome transmission fidelity protein 4 n=1 Tax=Podospora didyma TaxID=330526 RepID=A0AAE0NTE3_9PEZI|nr:hypothetical protein B0H63DRAFT_150924 [Podospora didyma]
MSAHTRRVLQSATQGNPAAARPSCCSPASWPTPTTRAPRRLQSQQFRSPVGALPSQYLQLAPSYTRASFSSLSPNQSSAAAAAQILTTTTPPVQDAPNNLPKAWFDGHIPSPSPSSSSLLAWSSSSKDMSWKPAGPPDKEPPDPNDRKVKLGKTLRILQERLPTLLQTPLPQEVLSPNITLHLFPSTHPHLPTVTGRVAYIAALWSSPIAWNRVPLVGNVKLEILSERMVDSENHTTVTRQRQPGAHGEQLIVRWRTIGKNSSKKATAAQDGREVKDDSGGTAITDAAENKRPVGTAQPVGSSKEFTGLFIFDFDKEGRILSHTIEHVQESGQWEKGVGAKVVHLTDWLLGGIKGDREGSDTPVPAFANTAASPVGQKDR